ncbi:10656_t:CDS:2, partial [Dentiscutata heterogama]
VNATNPASTSSDECNSYISESLIKSGPYYYVNFSIPPAYGYKLVLAYNNATQYSLFGYDIYGNRGEQIISFAIRFLDQNTNPSLFLEVSDSENIYSKETISSTFLQSISMTNTYQILPSESTSIFLERYVKKFIIPGWKATMGFQPDYEIISYLNSRKSSRRTQTNQNGSDFFTLGILADYDTIIIETEQRTHTILSSLGLLGGVWSIATIAYKLLFGDDSIQPFGLIQKFGHFNKLNQKKLTEHLSTIPLVQGSFNNIDGENRVVRLDKKINNLELFLRDYVVEVQQLDKIYKNIEK